MSERSAGLVVDDTPLNVKLLFDLLSAKDNDVAIAHVGSFFSSYQRVAIGGSPCIHGPSDRLKSECYRPCRDLAR